MHTSYFYSTYKELKFGSAHYLPKHSYNFYSTYKELKYFEEAKIPLSLLEFLLYL